MVHGLSSPSVQGTIFRQERLPPFFIIIQAPFFILFYLISFFYRYLGTTPNSSSLAPLLTSICQQLSYTFMLPFEDIPEDLVPLTAHMKELLTHVIFSPPLQKLFKMQFSFKYFKVRFRG